MSGPGSVTLWIAQLKAGDRAAAQPLWENYCRQLVTRARRRVPRTLNATPLGPLAVEPIRAITVVWTRTGWRDSRTS
jgi:hypothetical protein